MFTVKAFSCGLLVTGVDCKVRAVERLFADIKMRDFVLSQ
jgi:hypothetical protein